MQMMFNEAQKQAVWKALENPDYSWRTIEGLASETALEPGVVLSVISHLEGEIVRSSIKSKDGQELYSTRNHFRKFASPTTRLMGALKNRLD